MRSIAELEKRIQHLEKENQYLRNLLIDARIPCPVNERNACGSVNHSQVSRHKFTQKS